MTFTLYVQRDDRGHLVKKPKGTRVFLDIDKNRTATVFEGERLVGEMRVVEFQAHAAGLFLNGVVTERLADGDRSKYQEWFLSYGEAE